MADNKIVHRISLEGDAEINKKFDAVAEHGKRAFKDIKAAAEGSNSGGHFSAIGGDADSGRQGLERLREAIHTLHPILDTAGLGLGNLGAFARVAGAGLGALGAAIVGSVVVGLAKLADQSDTARKKLADLKASPGTFGRLQEDAKKLGTDVDNLIPSYQELQKLRNNANETGAVRRPTKFEQPDGTVSSEGPVTTPPDIKPFGDNELHAANISLLSLLHAAKADNPSQIAQQFNSSLAQNQRVTPEAFKALSDQAPGAADKFAQSLGRGFEGYQQLQKYLDGHPLAIKADEAVTSLARIEPEAVKAAKAVRGLGDAFSGLGASFNEVVKSFAGENFGKLLTNQIDKTSRSLEDTAKEISGIKQTISSAVGGFVAGATEPTGKIPLTDALGNPTGFDLPPQTAPEPRGSLTDFLKNAATDPGALGADQSLPPLVGYKPQPFQYIPPPKEDFQYIPPPPEQRSEAELPAAGDAAAKNISDLGEAAAEAAAKLRGVESSAPAEQPAGHAGGGHIRGPGGPRDDKIPAMLSDGEFVVNAADTKRNRGLLEAINAGRYADGGNVSQNATSLPPGDHEITATEDGGAIIDGVLYPFGSPILQNPAVKQKIAESLAGMKASGSKRTHKSDFVGLFGGHEFDTEGTFKDGGPVGGFSGGGPVGRFAARLGAMGLNRSFDIPHFAMGGHVADFELPSGAMDSIASSSGPGADIPHLGSLDLRTNHGDFTVMAPEQVVRQMSRAAVAAASIQASPSPSWRK